MDLIFFDFSCELLLIIDRGKINIHYYINNFFIDVEYVMFIK